MNLKSVVENPRNECRIKRNAADRTLSYSHNVKCVVMDFKKGRYITTYRLIKHSSTTKMHVTIVALTGISHLTCDSHGLKRRPESRAKV